MKSLLSKIRRLLLSEDGPIAVEYSVMLVVIVVVCLAGIALIGTQTNLIFENVNDSIGPS